MDEFGGAQVGDARLGRRLIKLVDRLGDAPSASIPGACNGRTETQAAYRFFDQARADKRGLGWESVLAPHMARTEARMAAHPVVLCLQDTGARQDSCRLIHAALCCLTSIATTASRSGLRVTAVMGDQSRVGPVQRAG